jgi:hypothetical protein
LTTARLTVVFRVAAFATGFLTDDFFAIVLDAAGFLEAVPFSVASSIALTAVWIDLIAFIAVRLLA